MMGLDSKFYIPSFKIIDIAVDEKKIFEVVLPYMGMHVTQLSKVSTISSVGRASDS